MDFNQLFLKRQSVRAYLPKIVEKEKILACLEAARMAPSACNSQAWTFIIVNDLSIKEKVAKATHGAVVAFNKFTHQAPVLVVVAMEAQNISSKLGSSIKDIDYAHIDVGIAVEHFCLQAAELELGTCILGWFNESKIKEILSIPKNIKVGLVISLGYASEDIIRKKVRKEIKDISCYNKYCK